MLGPWVTVTPGKSYFKPEHQGHCKGTDSLPFLHKNANQKDGWIDVWIDRWMDRLKDGWFMDGWVSCL